MNTKHFSDRGMPPLAKTLSQVYGKYANRTALIYENNHISYQELAQRVTFLAGHIRLQLCEQAETAPSSQYIALYHERGIDMVVSMLAAAHCGLGYIPISTDAPAQRTQFILQDSQPALILTHSHLSKVDAIAGRPQLCVDTLSPREALDTAPAQTQDAIGYVIYTSGTTGQPKGVQIPAQNILHLADTHIDAFNTPQYQRALLFASYIFDASVFELFVHLLLGQSVYIASEHERKDAQALSTLVQQNDIEFASIPPALLALIPPQQLSALKCLIVAGETPNVAMLEAYSQVTAIYNGYGPTENTVATSLHRFSPQDSELNIGQPLNDTRLYVLDPQLNPCPPSEVGELYISSPRLALGYLNRDELTQSRFIANPFYDPQSDASGFSRLYKTGDLASFDGQEYHFAGRDDGQVKLRGFRIELEEIEQTIATLDTVKLVSCVIKQQGNRRLLAAYVVTQHDEATQTQDIANHLSRTLPDYMQPDLIVLLSQLPMTENGKTDKRALAALPIEVEHTHQDAQLSHTQHAFLTLMQGYCPAELHWHSDYFEQGGDSISAIRIANEVQQQLKLHLDTQLIYRLRTPAQIWQALLTHNTRPPVDIAPRAAHYQHTAPLSAQQSGLWFLARQAPDNLAYHSVSRLTLSGVLDPAALQGALSALVQRHEIYRTSFDLHEPLQHIHPHCVPELPVLDYSDLSEQDAQAKITQHLARLNAPFKLDSLPLARWTLVKLDTEKHVLLQVEHHLIHDGWSANQFATQLLALYAQLNNGESLATMPDVIQYADYACHQAQWLDSEQAQQQRLYWQAQLQSASPRINLPVSQLAQDVPVSADTFRLELPRRVWQQLQQFCQRNQITPFSATLATLYVVLSRFSGDEDICIGSAMANRNHPQLETTMGMLVNTVVHRLQSDPQTTINELIQQSFEVCAEAQANQAFPFPALVDALNVPRIPGVNPLFQVCFTFQDTPLPATPQDTFKDIQLDQGAPAQDAKFELNIAMLDMHSQDPDRPVVMQWEYDRSRYDLWFIESMANNFAHLLAQLVTCTSPSALSQPLAALAPAATQPEPLTTPLHSSESLTALFEQQAQRQPGNTALFTSTGSMSYDQLTRRANRLAHWLMAQNVAGQFVGLYLPPGPDTLIAILGVLKAGAAYVPLSTRAPVSRNGFILEDAQVQVVISYRELIDDLNTPQLTPLFLEDEATLLSYPDTSPTSSITGVDPAYVIYTSGTTGKPKGVVQTHGNVARLLSAAEQHFSFSTQDTWVLYHDYIFDFSVWEIWGALAYGGKLFIPDYLEIRDSMQFVEQCQQFGVTVLNQTPSAFYTFADIASTAQMPLNTLRYVIFGGEQLNYSKLAPWWQQYGDRITLVNMYGITETTVHVTALTLSATMPRHIADIGQPLADMQALVLDEQHRPVPVGCPGELYITGAGLAAGYLNRDTLSAERFFTLTLGERECRVYRTGDKARQLPTGHLEYLGRLDDQVKIRGHRIELGEIETQLLTFGEISKACVLTYDNQGQTALVGYIVPAVHTSECEALRQRLATRLPNYMIPDQLIALDAFPLTVNGKLDKKALPAPSLTSQSNYVAPQTPLQRQLCQLWQQILGVSQVGIQDDFFQLGGNSILAVKLVREAQESMQLAMPLSALLNYPNIATLAEHLSSTQVNTIVRSQRATQTSAKQVMEL
ncbi:non-ribosomal peptide synthetase [Pseudoalteromonas sp. McH1-42]|uniref:non-ribosomal peptide synthetase n=1 Tax=Pseudoalteromonas sp. McH1-42 TaxID=2917752 RepID=UPI001EF63608|nr:amino acid adenylation domain-containing protein [Pseudoalteromonas sp. McH1-42]